MGIPFPAGLTILKNKSLTSVIWAWSVNGYFSVIASIGVNILLSVVGFQLTAFIASVLYFIAGASIISLNKNIYAS